jgi:hypothetical protein
MSNRFSAVLAVVALALFAVAPAAANHGPLSGHIAPSNANVDLVGKLKVSNVVPESVTDVATYRDTAYLGRWPVPDCPGGFWSIDISNPANPRELTFVQSPADAYLTEGVHALRLTTPAFNGVVLVASQETCTGEGSGGVSIYDVTNPANPQPLSLGRGDTEGGTRAHDSHSAFAWDAGDRAFVVMVDNEEALDEDIDIMEITDPRNPRYLGETGIGDWTQAHDNMSYGEDAGVHDLIVRRVEGRWEMLASNWDAGYVRVDMTDPANPRYISDSDHPATDPLTGVPISEGNAHEAEWDRCPEEGVRSRFPCGDVRFILGADEDFSPFRPVMEVTTGPSAGPAQAGEFGFTRPLETNFPTGVTGPTVFGGTACPGQDLNGNGMDDYNEIPAAATIPVNPGEFPILVTMRGGTPACFFSDKIRAGEDKGYRVVIVGNHHAGTSGGLFPNAFVCGGQGSPVRGTASALCIGHRLLHSLFRDNPEYTPPDTSLGPDMPAVGTVGDRIRARGGVFDGWGYLNLINADTMEHIDAYAVPEALDPRFARGFGDLSIHEITTDPTGDVGHLAWYSAGYRVVEYSGGRLREVGHHIDTNGNNHWGIELNVRRDGRLFALASDRDYGLYIYRFGTDLRVSSTDARGRVGRPMTLRSTVRNDGTIAETNAKWSMRLPAGFRLASAFSSQGRCSVTGRRVNCNLGQIAEGGRAGIVLRLVSSRAGTRRSETLIAGRKAEYDVGNNSDRVALRVRAVAGAAGAGAGGALTGRP